MSINQSLQMTTLPIYRLSRLLCNLVAWRLQLPRGAMLRKLPPGRRDFSVAETPTSGNSPPPRKFPLTKKTILILTASMILNRRMTRTRASMKNLSLDLQVSNLVQMSSETSWGMSAISPPQLDQAMLATSQPMSLTMSLE